MFRKVRSSFKFLFTGPLILLLLVVINWMTTPGEWWVQWATVVALGGLAAFVAYLRR